MNFQIIDDYSGISSLRDEWNRLAGDHPLLSWEWHSAWLKEMCRSGDRPCVIVERSCGEVAMIAPMYFTRSRSGAGKLCLTGDGRTCTDYGQLICEPGQHGYAAAKLASWIGNADPEFPPVDFVEFQGLAGNAATTAEIEREFSRIGLAESTQLENCWVVDLPSTWDELNASFSRKHRRKTKKAVQRLADCQIFDTRSTGFNPLWNTFVDLHQRRRKSLGEEGCFADQRFTRFLKQATNGLFRRGLAELFVVEYRTEPVAAALTLNSNSRTFMYQCGFDPNWSQLEPGYLMIVMALQRAISAGRQTFDFLRGDEPYKSRWQARPEPMSLLHVQIRDTLQTRISGVWQASKNQLRQSLSHFSAVADSNSH